MPAHNPSPILDQPEDFDSLLQESQKLLQAFRTELTQGERVLDPSSRKKKELLVRLKPIMEQLRQHWEWLQTQDENSTIAISGQLTLAMQDFKDIIIGSSALAANDKGEVQEQINLFNKKTADLNKLFEEYQVLSENADHINRLEYGRDLSDYMSYGTSAIQGIVIVGLAWFQTLSHALKTAGAIFYPIGAAFTTCSKLFNFLSSTFQFFIASREANNNETDELRKLELENAKALLRKNSLFKMLVFTLNLLSVLAFAGVLATPAGWALVAGATFVEWLDEGVGASQRADKALQAFKEKHEAALVNPEKTPTTLLQELTTLQKNADKAKLEAQWGLVNTIGMVLIACSPIPFAGPALGGIGLALFSIAAIRNAYIAVKPHAEAYFAGKKSKKGPKETREQDKNENTLKVELQAIRHKKQAPAVTTQQGLLIKLSTPPDPVNQETMVSAAPVSNDFKSTSFQLLNKIGKNDALLPALQDAKNDQVFPASSDTPNSSPLQNSKSQ